MTSAPDAPVFPFPPRLPLASLLVLALLLSPPAAWGQVTQVPAQVQSDPEGPAAPAGPSGSDWT